nr:MAG TPA: nucleoporin [Caudoviricetes sp.]
MVDYALEQLSQTDLGSRIIIILSVIAIIAVIIKYAFVYLKKGITAVASITIAIKQKSDDWKSLTDQITSVTADLKDIHNDLKMTTQSLAEVTKQMNEEKNRRKEMEKKVEELETKLETLDRSSDKTDQQILELLNDHHEEIKSISRTVANINNSIPMIIESDVETFRTYLVDTYERCKESGTINIYTLQTLAKRFKNYQKEGGNTWAKTLMEAIEKFEPTTIPAIDEYYAKKENH